MTTPPESFDDLPDEPSRSGVIEPPPMPREGGARHILAIGGGKGGVGKSLIAANLGIYLAQIGKRVVLLDGDLGGANLHTFLGIDRPQVTLGDFFDKRVDRIEKCVVETQVNGLGLLSAEGDPLWAANPRPATKNRLLNQVRALDVDYLICDLPPGSGFIALDLFLVADTGVLVVTPEPTSIENTWRFIKSAFLRRLRTVRGLERLATDRTYEGGIPAPLDLYRAAEKNDPPLAVRVLDEIQRFRPRLVVNNTRTRQDLELGPLLRAAGRRRLGLPVEYLGHLESDDAVWLAVRKRRPVVVDHPESKVAKDVEKIARRLLGLESEKLSPLPPPRPTEEQTLYQALEIDPGASDEEIRRAARRGREVYAAESMVVCGLFSPERLQIVQQRIEQAHDTLLDPERRHAYDILLFPDGIPARTTPALGIPSTPPRPDETPLRAPSLAPPPPPEPTVGPETEFTGDLLRRIREARQIELADIAQRTKIGLSHLRAIEEERFEALPATVYLRGFLVEMARCLKLDLAQVTRTYLDRFHRARPAREA